MTFGTTTNTPRILRLFILLAGLVPAMLSIAQETPTPFGTVVEVSRILTEVRVVAYDGSPVLGLGAEDFTVKIGGERVDVESVTWIPSTAEAAADSLSHQQAAQPIRQHESPPPPEGRLIVMLFQNDFTMHISRTVGLVRMAPKASEFVGNLGPEDKIALLVFESHLQLRSDFTKDHAALAEMVNTREILKGDMEPPKPVSPSMADSFDFEEARKAANMARALELIGEALKPIPGTKSLVFFGWGLGRMSAGARVTVGDGYRKAMEALSVARTSVFSLDITNADYHSLGVGLRTVAEDTGGFYVKTHLFPDTAMKKLVRVISSYYELSMIPPPDLGESYTIEVMVKRPRTEVYVRQYHPSPALW